MAGHPRTWNPRARSTLVPAVIASMALVVVAIAGATIVGAAEYDFAERDLRYTRPMFELLTNDREFADHNRAIMQGWLSAWVPRCLAAARTLQPIWSQPDQKPPRFEDGLDACKSRFAGILTDINLEAPEELAQ